MKRFMNMRISKKLVTAFLIVSILAAAIGAYGIVNVSMIGSSNTKLYENDSLSLRYAGEAGVIFQQIRYNSVNMLLAKLDTDTMKTLADEVSYLLTLMDENLALLDAAAVDPEIAARVDKVTADWNKLKPIIKQVNDELASTGTAQSLTLMSEQDFINVRDELVALFDQIATMAEASSTAAKVMWNTSSLIMIIVIIICIVISVLLGLFIAKIIGRPVAFAAKIANMLAVGNLDTNQMQTGNNEALYARQDEVGELARAFRNLTNVTAQQASVINQVEQGDLTIDVEVRSENDILSKSLSGLVNNLNDVVSGIISAADQVASGAQLVSNSSMTLSQGATEQASSVEELTASLEEISSQTALNAQNAEKASDMATNAKKEAEQGNTQMNALLKAMDAINASSNSINKVIKVIDDIAFQTNILALNAAVEAARAGQHGKGFAVVAEEVRTLAGKSANAVKDTTEMIDGSIRNVESGIKIANATAEALKRIVNEVSNATELVGSIAIASKEQALGIEQLNQGIIQVSQVVQNNAATSEESAAASEELSSQADQLKEVVSVFQVKNSRANEPAKLTAASVRVPSQARALPSDKPRAKIALEGDFGKY